MELKFEFVIYDEELDSFELDDNIYTFVLDEEQAKTFEILKDGELYLYNWFKDSSYFLDWIKEEVYPDSTGKKIAIATIDDILYLKFYFFKVTSADTFYDYFQELFGILSESDWQDREEVGEQILEQLAVKRQELIIELKEDEDEQV